ncbi:MAG: glycosyltransferase family 4 protein [Desulfomonilaceae bacterium]
MKRLAIVQTRPTQFDGPLFRKLAMDKRLNLAVYYSAPVTKGLISEDPEIGAAPIWDNDIETGYDSTTRSQGPAAAWAFARQIVAHQPDLLIISGYAPVYHLLIAIWARFKGISVGLRSDTTLEHSSSSGRQARLLLKRLLMPFVLSLYTAGHPVGTLARKYLIRYGFPEDRIFEFPYAVDNEWFEEQSDAHRLHRNHLREKIGIPAGAFVIVGVVKFVEREDPITLIRGFASFQTQFQNAHLVLVGDGPLRTRIEGLAEFASSNVHLPGFVPYSRLPMYYAISDVFVHPAVRESWGVSVNEAMACGLPVIVSQKVGSHVDLVREGKTGFLFEPGNPDALARCLTKIAEDANLQVAMSVKAQEMIKGWGYDCVAASIDKALTSIRR